MMFNLKKTKSSRKGLRRSWNSSTGIASTSHEVAPFSIETENVWNADPRVRFKKGHPVPFASALLAGQCCAKPGNFLAYPPMTTTGRTAFGENVEKPDSMCHRIWNVSFEGSHLSHVPVRAHTSSFVFLLSHLSEFHAVKRKTR